MTTYYVDFENGKAENDGLSSSCPIRDYQTLDLHPGDRVLFRRGSFVRGPLHAKNMCPTALTGKAPFPPSVAR